MKIKHYSSSCSHTTLIHDMDLLTNNLTLQMQNLLRKNTQDITFCKVIRESTCEGEMPLLV